MYIDGPISHSRYTVIGNNLFGLWAGRLVGFQQSADRLVGYRRAPTPPLRPSPQHTNSIYTLFTLLVPIYNYYIIPYIFLY